MKSPVSLSRKRGRKFWVPADLDEVEKLASYELVRDTPDPARLALFDSLRKLY